jgi:hypothetical protein
VKIEPYEEKFFLDKCDPLIHRSFTTEQAHEVQRLISLSMRNRGNHVKKIQFNLWFFHLYFVTLYVGKEKRSVQRLVGADRKHPRLFLFTMVLLSYIVVGFFMILIFSILYVIKSSLGIDIFQDQHLSDFLVLSKEFYHHTHYLNVEKVVTR